MTDASHIRRIHAEQTGGTGWLETYIHRDEVEATGPARIIQVGEIASHGTSIREKAVHESVMEWTPVRVKDEYLDD